MLDGADRMTAADRRAVLAPRRGETPRDLTRSAKLLSLLNDGDRLARQLDTVRMSEVQPLDDQFVSAGSRCNSASSTMSYSAPAAVSPSVTTSIPHSAHVVVLTNPLLNGVTPKRSAHGDIDERDSCKKRRQTELPREPLRNTS